MFLQLPNCVGAGGGSGLLDGATNVFAAKSFRNLYDATTNVGRVRRSSDSAESDFTAAQWIDGTLTAWVGANDGFLVKRYDQSGNGRDDEQTTQSLQPYVVKSGTLVTDQGVASIENHTTSSLYMNETVFPSDLTILFTARWEVGIASGSRFICRDTTSTQYFLYGRNGFSDPFYIGVGNITTNSYLNQVLQSWGSANRNTIYDIYADSLPRLYTGRNLDISAWGDYIIGNNGTVSNPMVHDHEEIILTSTVGLSDIEDSMMTRIGL